MKLSRHLITLFSASLLLTVACKKDDDKKISGAITGQYYFDYTIDGKNYQWSGGIPAPDQGQCTYAITNNEATISMTRDAPGGINFDPVVLITLPVGTGSFKLNETTADLSSHGFSTSLSQSESVSHGKSTEITVNITEIGSGQFGKVTGTFTGNAVYYNLSTLQEKTVNVTGKFTACKLE